MTAPNHKFSIKSLPKSEHSCSEYSRRKNLGGTVHPVKNGISPNGITTNITDKQVYVGVTRSQQIWRLPVMHDGQISKTGVALQLSGGVGGPDGIEMDAENGLLVCQLGVGIWFFNANRLPTHLVHSNDPRHHHLANLVFGGPDYKRSSSPSPCRAIS